MSKIRVTFSEVRQSAMQRVIDYLRSRASGSATTQEIKWFCRHTNMTGMQEAILDWLEQTGEVRYERDIGAVYLVKPGEAAPMPADEVPIGGTD